MEYLEGLNIFDPEDLLNTLLRKIAVEPVPKEVQWWEAQGRFENLIEAEFRRGITKPFFDNFCDSPAFYANASPDVVRNYYMKVVKISGGHEDERTNRSAQKNL